jgi:hypothetical protein
MYFKQIDEIANGTKTVTRRVCKPGEWIEYDTANGDKYYTSVFTATNRLKWQVGRDYAVSPGRGKPVVVPRRRAGMQLELARRIHYQR